MSKMFKGSALCRHGFEDGKDCEICYEEWAKGMTPEQRGVSYPWDREAAERQQRVSMDEQIARAQAEVASWPNSVVDAVTASSSLSGFFNAEANNAEMLANAANDLIDAYAENMRQITRLQVELDVCRSMAAGLYFASDMTKAQKQELEQKIATLTARINERMNKED